MPTNGRRHSPSGLDGFGLGHIGPKDSAVPGKRNPGILLIPGGSSIGVAGKKSAQALLGRSQSGPRRIRSFGESPRTGRLLASRHFAALPAQPLRQLVALAISIALFTDGPFLFMNPSIQGLFFRAGKPLLEAAAAFFGFAGAALGATAQATTLR